MMTTGFSILILQQEDRNQREALRRSHPFSEISSEDIQQTSNRDIQKEKLQGDEKSKGPSK